MDLQFLPYWSILVYLAVSILQSQCVHHLPSETLAKVDSLWLTSNMPEILSLYIYKHTTLIHYNPIDRRTRPQGRFSVPRYILFTMYYRPTLLSLIDLIRNHRHPHSRFTLPNFSLPPCECYHVTTSILSSHFTNNFQTLLNFPFSNISAFQGLARHIGWEEALDA